MRVGVAALLTLAATAVVTLGGAGQTLTVNEVLKLTAPPADHRVPYGEAPEQFGDLRLPRGPGPYPVVILLHGGCWRASYGLTLMDAMAARFTEMGYATWNVEYRRLGSPGGGFPGTFLDLGRAADHLRTLAPRDAFDLSRVAAIGHSAGGHLALWLAGRHRLPASSVLHVAAPLEIAGVVSLAGITDLARAREEAICGTAPSELVGGQDQMTDARLRETSPVSLLPLGVPQRLITGELDRIVPPSFAERYERAARAAGDDVRSQRLAGAGHFEVIVPDSVAWTAIETALESLALRKAR